MKIPWAEGSAGWAEHFFSPAEEVRAFASGKAKEASCRDALNVSKSISVPAGAQKMQFGYRLKNSSKRAAKFLFGLELNFSLLDAHFNRLGEAAGVLRFAVVDPLARQEVAVALSRPARLWYFPVEANVKSASGTERVYRGVRLACLWEIRLPPGRIWSVRGELETKGLNGDE